jgi:hypothetical protein
MRYLCLVEYGATDATEQMEAASAKTSALIAYCTTKADRVSSRLTVFAKLGYTAGYQWKGGTPLSPERSWGSSSFENDTEFEAVLSGIDTLTQS